MTPNEPTARLGDKTVTEAEVRAYCAAVGLPYPLPGDAMKNATLAEARKCLSYDPDTGLFTRIGTRGHMQPGSVAGHVNPRGYRHINIGDCTVRAHRLAWWWVYGEVPASEIDHIDGNKDNNRIANLRIATRSQNQQNRHHAQRNNRIGILGVRRRREFYQARITVSGECRYLGTFNTAKEASDAYLMAKAELHPFSPQCLETTK